MMTIRRLEKRKRGQLWVNEKQISIIENEKNNIKWSDEKRGFNRSTDPPWV